MCNTSISRLILPTKGFLALIQGFMTSTQCWMTVTACFTTVLILPLQNPQSSAAEDVPSRFPNDFDDSQNHSGIFCTLNTSERKRQPPLSIIIQYSTMLTFFLPLPCSSIPLTFLAPPYSYESIYAETIFLGPFRRV